jgi:hypothetical protein
MLSGVNTDFDIFSLSLSIFLKIFEKASGRDALDGRSADNKALMCAEQRGKNVDKRHC